MKHFWSRKWPASVRWGAVGAGTCMLAWAAVVSAVALRGGATPPAPPETAPAAAPVAISIVPTTPPPPAVAVKTAAAPATVTPTVKPATKPVATRKVEPLRLPRAETFARTWQVVAAKAVTRRVGNVREVLLALPLPLTEEVAPAVPPAREEEPTVVAAWFSEARARALVWAVCERQAAVDSARASFARLTDRGQAHLKAIAARAAAVSKLEEAAATLPPIVFVSPVLFEAVVLEQDEDTDAEAVKKLEKLDSAVLRARVKKLTAKKADNPELQDFIDRLAVESIKFDTEIQTLTYALKPMLTGKPTDEEQFKVLCREALLQFGDEKLKVTPAAVSTWWKKLKIKVASGAAERVPRPRETTPPAQQPVIVIPSDQVGAMTWSMVPQACGPQVLPSCGWSAPRRGCRLFSGRMFRGCR